jgi:hypothetical protein
MQYLVLLYGDPADDPTPGTPEWDADMERYMAFGDLAGDAILGGEALWPEVVRTVRHDGEAVAVTDGPYAEVTEALGGFYLLEAPDLDAVIDLARHIPVVAGPSGAAEIRPLVMVLPGPEDAGPGPEGTARHLATIHGTAGPDDVPGTPEWEAASEAHRRFSQEHAATVIGGAAVHPSSAATTIRVRDGELLVSDGPFSEVVEVVGGYYLLRGTPEQVEAAATAIPVPEGGAVQVGQVMELG